MPTSKQKPDRRDFVKVLALLAGLCIPETAKAKNKKLKIQVKYLFSSNNDEDYRSTKPHLNADKDVYDVFQDRKYVGKLTINFICRGYMELRDRSSPFSVSFTSFFGLTVMLRQLPKKSWEKKWVNEPLLCTNDRRQYDFDPPLHDQRKVRHVASLLLDKSVQQMKEMIENYKTVYGD